MRNFKEILIALWHRLLRKDAYYITRYGASVYKYTVCGHCGKVKEDGHVC